MNRGRLGSNVSLENVLLGCLSASIMIGTNFPFFEISGRMVYLGTTEIFVGLLAIVVSIKLLLGSPVFVPKKVVNSVVMFSVMLAISAMYQLLIAQIEVSTKVFIEIIRWYEYVAVLFTVLLAVKTERQIKIVLGIMLVCAVANIATAIYQVATFDFYAQRIYGLFVSAANREGLAISNPNVFGVVVMASSLFFLSFLLQRGGKYRFFYLILFALNFVVLVMTFSRSSFLGFLVGFVVLLVLYKISLKILTLLGTVGILFLGSLYFSTFLQARLLGTFGNTGSSIAFESISIRLLRWKFVILDLSDHLFLGIGYGNFSSYYDIFTPDQYYIEVLVTTGVIGLCLLLFMFSRIMFYVYRAKPDRHTFYFSFRAGYIAAFSGILVANMFAGLFFNPRVLGVFWLFTALMLRLIQLNTTVTKNTVSYL